MSFRLQHLIYLISIPAWTKVIFVCRCDEVNKVFIRLEMMCSSESNWYRVSFQWNDSLLQSFVPEKCYPRYICWPKHTSREKLFWIKHFFKSTMGIKTNAVMLRIVSFQTSLFWSAVNALRWRSCQENNSGWTRLFRAFCVKAMKTDSDSDPGTAAPLTAYWTRSLLLINMLKTRFCHWFDPHFQLCPARANCKTASFSRTFSPRPLCDVLLGCFVLKTCQEGFPHGRRTHHSPDRPASLTKITY